jgi:hypothetical protein
MSNYLISYDLKKPVKEYADLIAELTHLGAVKCLYSEWLLETDADALHIVNHLLKFMDGDDQLLVLELGSDAAFSSTLRASAQNWLNTHL